MRRLRPAIIFLPTTSSPRSLHCRHQIIGQIIRPLTNPTSATVNVAPCVPANRGPPTRGPPTAVQRHRIPANQSWELQCNSPGAAQGLDRVRQPTAMENDWAGCWTPPFTPKKKQERREEGGVGCEASLSLTWREPPPPRPSPRCWPMYPPSSPFLPLLLLYRCLRPLRVQVEKYTQPPPCLFRVQPARIDLIEFQTKRSLFIIQSCHYILYSDIINISNIYTNTL